MAILPPSEPRTPVSPAERPLPARVSLAKFTVLFLVFATGVAAEARAAVESLPAIVTYEMKKQRKAERAQAKNPKAFWFKQVAARVESRMSLVPKGMKTPADLQIRFVVARDGHIVSSAIDRTSGTSATDEAALKMLAQAQPFPPIPEVVTDDSVTFSVPVRFR